ncbi:CLUMA_CG008280, isoform A [Clunio marinus]|uniref:CLUMA_CG008280, isoform A n=1 Tax=Clunio marinus TaxID=568069 RepID=A0A1J1I4V0_9DIPT|nr:CLUMA_CG008280, isoform A [Clunio marinus]
MNICVVAERLWEITLLFIRLCRRGKKIFSQKALTRKKMNHKENDDVNLLLERIGLHIMKNELLVYKKFKLRTT